MWAIYTVDDEGGAHIEEVYPNELDALRANKNNTDPARKVRFLPYGIAVSVLDDRPTPPTPPNSYSKSLADARQHGDMRLDRLAGRHAAKARGASIRMCSVTRVPAAIGSNATVVCSRTRGN